MIKLYVFERYENSNIKEYSVYTKLDSALQAMQDSALKHETVENIKTVKMLYANNKPMGMYTIDCKDYEGDNYRPYYSYMVKPLEIK